VLSLGARDEDGRRDDEVEPPEFLVAGDVLCRDTFGALGEGFLVTGLLFHREFALGMGIEIGAVTGKNEHEEQLGVKAR
jgi:hypothetical protein